MIRPKKRSASPICIVLLIFGLLYPCLLPEAKGADRSSAEVLAEKAGYAGHEDGPHGKDGHSLGLEQNPELRAARESLKVAESGRVKARLWLPSNPTLELDYSTDRYFSNEGEGGFRVGVSQELDLPLFMKKHYRKPDPL